MASWWSPSCAKRNEGIACLGWNTYAEVQGFFGVGEPPIVTRALTWNCSMGCACSLWLYKRADVRCSKILFTFLDNFTSGGTHKLIPSGNQPQIIWGCCCSS